MYPRKRALLEQYDDIVAGIREKPGFETFLIGPRFKELREAYPGSRLLIVSNTSGSRSDPGGLEAEKVEKSTGVRVLRHSVKVCHALQPDAIQY